MSKDFENFKKFEEFFSNTKPDGILSWNRGNAFIELDWMFSDLLERKYVKQAIANIMQKNNPTYKQNCKYKNNKNPEYLLSSITDEQVYRASEKVYKKLKK